MPVRYHLTTRGVPAPCHARQRPCPRGGAEDHFPSREVAQEAFERQQAEGSSHLKPLRRREEGSPLTAFTQGLLRPGERLEVYERSGYQVVEALVLSPEERGQGRGTELMEALVQEADARDLKLALTPSQDFGATSTARLKRFYKRFGFQENKGRGKDFTTREAMIRQPGGVKEAATPSAQPLPPPPGQVAPRVLPPPPDLSTASLRAALEAQGVSPAYALAGVTHEPQEEALGGRTMSLEEGRALQGTVDDLSQVLSQGRGEGLTPRETLLNHPRYSFIAEGTERVAVRDGETGWVLKYPHGGREAQGEAKREQYSYALLETEALREVNARYASTYFFTSSQGEPVVAQEYVDPGKHTFLDADNLTNEQMTLFWDLEAPTASYLWDVNDMNAFQEVSGRKTIVLVDCLRSNPMSIY